MRKHILFNTFEAFKSLSWVKLIYRIKSFCTNGHCLQKQKPFLVAYRKFIVKFEVKAL